jgi:transposase
MSDASPRGQHEMWPEARPEIPSPTPTPPERAEEREQPRLKPINRQQLLLRTVDVEQLVEPDHRVRAIWELVGRLDLTGFEQPIAAVEGRAGRPAWDPQLLISLWVYAYSEGVSSAREVERRCAYHPAYQWLTGMSAVNHHTLSDFRGEHQEALDELFAQLLGVLSAEGLITLERVMHDGTKVKAAASGDSFHRQKTLQAHLEAAREQVRAMGDPRPEEPSRRAAAARERAAREKVEKLEQALEEMKKVQAAAGARVKPSERRVSETDPEARVMKQSDGGYAPSHNVQISTDAAHSIIVGVGVTQAASDQGQLPTALEEIERNLGRLPQQVVTDGGFTTRETILHLEERGVDFIGGELDTGTEEAAERLWERRGIDAEFRPQAFTYEAERDTYTCPAGKPLVAQYTKHDRVGVLRQVYQARTADCQGCPFRPRCCPQAQRRTIVRTENVPVVAAYVERMKTEAARAVYRLRGGVAEFPNAWLKAKIGLRQFRVRGWKKARCEVLWACLTYNIQQWFRLRWKARPAPTLA